MPATWTPMSTLPACDLATEHGGVGPTAYADAALPWGGWGYVCLGCYTRLRCSLGTGRGQVLVQRQRREACPMTNDQTGSHDPGIEGCMCLLPEQMPAPPTPEEARYLDSVDPDIARGEAHLAELLEAENDRDAPACPPGECQGHVITSWGGASESTVYCEPQPCPLDAEFPMGHHPGLLPRCTCDPVPPEWKDADDAPWD